MVASRSQSKFRGEEESVPHATVGMRGKGRQVLAKSHRRVGWHLRCSSYLPEEVVPL